MKKHARSRLASIHLEENHPGCMWGILHILKYNHWHHVKKRLPYRQHGRGRQSAGKLDDIDLPQTPDRPQEHENAEKENSTVPAKKKTPVSVNKHSVKARLKALIAEERSRRKGQNSRSLISTQQSAPANSSLQCNGDQCHFQTQQKDGTNPRMHHRSSGSFNIHPDGLSENLKVDDRPESSNQQNSSQRVPQNSVVDTNKEFSDAPGFVSINDQLLQRILHDKMKFTPLRSHSQKHFNTKIDLQRYRTFHARDSTRASGSGKDGDGISNITFTPVLLPRLEDRSENPVAIKRFRDIKEKMHHVIKLNKNEKQRIMMDGVLDKIPNDQRLSEERKDELIKKFRDKVMNKDDTRRREFKRTSSLDRSMDKYSLLFESLQAKEPQDKVLRVDRRKKSLSRIFSSPEFNSYSLPSMESASNATTVETPNKADSSGAFMPESSSNVGRSKVLQDQLQFDKYSENDRTEEDTGDAESAAVEISKELAGIGQPIIASQLEAGVELSDFSMFTKDSQEIASFSELEDVGIIEIGAQKTSLIEHQGHPGVDKPLRPEVETDIEDTEFQEDGTLEVSIRVDTKDLERFDYVRDVLDLSGMCGPEALEAWNSDDQPVDPLVYEELERCLLMDKDCSRNEEREEFDRLLSFDLINEVLIDIYQKSVSYWPAPLSKHCRIHRMPLGPPLLKEVWANMSTCLSFRPELDPTQDQAVSRDLDKGRWMNLQFESECVGIELEELIFDDLLEELFD